MGDRVEEQGVAYTGSEYTDMIILYGRADYNANEASRQYAEMFPQRRHPNPRVILGAVRRGRDDGNLIPLPQRGAGHGVVGAPRVARNVENEEAVLACIEEDPTRSIRTIADLLGLSYSTVSSINLYIKEDLGKVGQGAMRGNLEFFL